MNLRKWVEEIQGQKNVGLNHVPIVVLGNKNDLIPDKDLTDSQIHKVLNELAEVYDNQKFPFFKTSAKTGENIHIALKTLIKDVLKKFM